MGEIASANKEEKLFREVNELLNDLLIEWRVVGLSREKLVKKIEVIYEKGDKNEIRTKKY